MMYGYGMGFWGLLMWLIPLAVLGFIVYLAVYMGIKNAMNDIKDKTDKQ